MAILFRWSRPADLGSIERRMRRLLEDFELAPAFAPAADMYETDTELVLKVDVPGYDESQLTVSVTDHTVTVGGDRKEATEKSSRHVHLTSGWRRGSSAASRFHRTRTRSTSWPSTTRACSPCTQRASRACGCRAVHLLEDAGTVVAEGRRRGEPEPAGDGGGEVAEDVAGVLDRPSADALHPIDVTDSRTLLRELEDGLASLAVAVRSADDALLAVVGIGGPTFRLGRARRGELLPLLQTAAAEPAASSHTLAR